jgi:large repetitive protein
MKNFLKKAFTLIELLVVIAIVGILSGLIVVSMNGMTSNATIAKAQIFSNSLKNSLMMNLIAEWKMDGDANDSWGGNNGTVTGVTFGSTGCIYNSCGTFDGASHYIDLGSGTNLTNVFASGASFTYSFWFYPTAFPTNWFWLFCKAYTSHTSPYYQVDAVLYPSGYVSTRVFNNSGTVYLPTTGSSAGSISLNNWYYLAVSVDLSSGVERVYLNGNLVNTASGTTGTYVNYSTSLALGANKNIYTTSAYDFIGKMDEVRLYNAAVPTSQIKEEYYAGLNNLVKNGSISKEEYAQRVSSLN